MTAYATFPSLVDRVVLVTGGGTGIGAAFVEAFAGSGAKVAFLDIQDEPSAALVERLAGARHRPVFRHCDLTDGTALEDAIAEIVASLGPVRALINNAADDRRQSSDRMTRDDWRKALAVNLDHQFFAAMAVRPGMRDAGGGAIVNLSSVAWIRGAPNLVAYAAAKAAIVGMTTSLAKELGPERIRVNAIAPGAVMTEKQLTLWYTEETARAMAERQCIHERLLPEHVARLALFLAADDGAMVTKQCIVVDAGLI